MSTKEQRRLAGQFSYEFQNRDPLELEMCDVCFQKHPVEDTKLVLRIPDDDAPDPVLRFYVCDGCVNHHGIEKIEEMFAANQ